MTNHTLIAREQAIQAEFETLPDVDAKYTHLFRLAESLPPLDPALKTEANRVHGCQSSLWFHLDCNASGLHLAAESDSLVISGIAALLIHLVEGCQPEDLDHLNLNFVDQMGIWKLPSARNNSLAAMLDHLKTSARNLPDGQDRNHPNA